MEKIKKSTPKKSKASRSVYITNRKNIKTEVPTVALDSFHSPEKPLTHRIQCDSEKKKNIKDEGNVSDFDYSSTFNALKTRRSNRKNCKHERSMPNVVLENYDSEEPLSTHDKAISHSENVSKTRRLSKCKNSKHETLMSNLVFESLDPMLKHTILGDGKMKEKIKDDADVSEYENVPALMAQKTKGKKGKYFKPETLPNVLDNSHSLGLALTQDDTDAFESANVSTVIAAKTKRLKRKNSKHRTSMSNVVVDNLHSLDPLIGSMILGDSKMQKNIDDDTDVSERENVPALIAPKTKKRSKAKNLKSATSSKAHSPLTYLIMSDNEIKENIKDLKDVSESEVVSTLIAPKTRRRVKHNLAKLVVLDNSEMTHITLGDDEIKKKIKDENVFDPSVIVSKTKAKSEHTVSAPVAGISTSTPKKVTSSKPASAKDRSSISKNLRRIKVVDDDSDTTRQTETENVPKVRSKRTAATPVSCSTTSMRKTVTHRLKQASAKDESSNTKNRLVHLNKVVPEKDVEITEESESENVPQTKTNVKSKRTAAATSVSKINSPEPKKVKPTKKPLTRSAKATGNKKIADVESDSAKAAKAQSNRRISEPDGSAKIKLTTGAKKDIKGLTSMKVVSKKVQR